MADRDLHSGDQAFAAVLGSLQREVRLLKSRAARPGAVRYDIRSGDDPLLTSVTGTYLTLNEMRLDPGMWVLLASGQVHISSASFNGREVVAGTVDVIPANGTQFELARAEHSPMCTTTSIGVGPSYSTTWTVIGVHHSDDPFTVLHRGSTGDWSGGSHSFSWSRATLLALPM